MNAPAHSEWTDANRQYLAAEFARLRALLAGDDPTEAAAEAALRRASVLSPPAIEVLAALFGLSGFERDLLLLVAGTEMDARLAEICGHGGPSFALALATLPNPHWSALVPSEPLRYWRLIEPDEGQSVTQARLRIDERILHFMAGLGYPDPRLGAFLREIAAPDLMDRQHRVLADTAAEALSGDAALPVLLLDGDDTDGQRDVAAMAAASLGLSLVEMAGSDLPLAARDQQGLALLWRREALLSGAGLFLLGGGEAATRFAERLDGFVAISGSTDPPRDRPWLRLTIDRPDTGGQRALWREALGTRADKLAPQIDGLSDRHRFSARRIALAAAGLAALKPAQAARHLQDLPRQSPPRLEGLAQELSPRAGWNDLVLPEAQQRILRQLIAHVRLRHRVHEDWGFAAKSARGLGLATLFWGESGTGKTLAAEVLADELALPLYRIDLSAIVSKYIGETEKNLARVFEAAEESGAILLFDEADALFGKRSEVRDSHDRYANIEVSYLLQRMEAYRGLAILTTNHKSALDPAFQRRLRFVVHFPFPDLRLREAIWRATLPAALPVEGVDFTRLARLAVTGGTIRNIALGAAFLAADEGQPVTMAHLKRAAQMDAAKRETALTEAEMRGWA